MAKIQIKTIQYKIFFYMGVYIRCKTTQKTLQKHGKISENLR